MGKTNENSKNIEVKEDIKGKTTSKKERKQQKKQARWERKRKCRTCKRKYRKGLTIGIWLNRENTNIFVLLLELIFAFILDTIRLLKNLLLGLVFILIICGVVGSIFAWIIIEPYYTEYNDFAEQILASCDYQTFKMDESTRIYDCNGDLIVKLTGNQDSSYLEYKDIPIDAVNAFIAIEDRTFWDNAGIDIKGLVRVGVDYIKTKGEEAHGASTITQQLARNIFLTREVSLERKAKEMLISLKLTQKFTKQEIMEFYINDICFANAVYGIEAAANAYFNKGVNELSLSQIAYLCAIPNSPEYYNPYKFPERAIDRRNKILEDMNKLGFITRTECDLAKAEAIIIERPTYVFNDYQSTYAIDCATKYIMGLNEFEFRYKFDSMSDYNNYKKEYAEAYSIANMQLVSGGYQIYTTLDKDIQTQMQESLDNVLAFDEEIDEETGIYAFQGALTVIDNSTGKVIATIGGRSQELDIQNYTLNRAYQSPRQPGSTIKPLVVYTPALMNGYKDTSIVQNISVTEAKKKGVDVQSLHGTAMTLRSALEQSQNGVAWQIFDKLGADECMSYLENMKFSNICPDDYFNASSLGGLTNGVTTVEMASAYSTLENHGVYRDVTCISSIIDRYGKDIYREPEETKVYRGTAVNVMVDMMTGVLTRGTARNLGWSNSSKMAAACKTGTTNDNKDGWLCGFTPYYTIAVWVGYDIPREQKHLYGASYSGDIWKDCMLKLIEDKEVIEYFDNADLEPGEEDIMTPSSGDEEFLPGRSDDEILSEGYTVRDYRNDREIGKGLDGIINGMRSLDTSDTGFLTKLQSYYSQGQSIVNQIYSIKYTAELQGKLDSTYNEMLLQAGISGSEE